jgi:hypothetical protein
MPQVESYLEVGVAGGVSASAAFAAMSDRPDLLVELCDIRPPAFDLPPGVVFHECDSLLLYARYHKSPWSCVFIDGDHSESYVRAELLELDRLGVKIRVFHDTNTDFEPGCRQVPAFFADRDFYVLHDRRERGLLMATTDRDAYKAASAFWLDN